MKLMVPSPVTAGLVSGAEGLAEVEGVVGAADAVAEGVAPGVASTNAEGGRPPMVSASAAFKA
jgi:Na+/alanine symporter